jgi:cytochrome o ubiquinol oxidase operon protein cyoD
MNQAEAPVQELGSMRSYVAGFIISIVLTLAAYIMVVNHFYYGWALVGAIIVLAVIQLLAQMILFLHLGRESKPRWKLGVFYFMLMVVLILVLGSLWIMVNLSYHHDHRSPGKTNQFIIKDEGYQQ